MKQQKNKKVILEKILTISLLVLFVCGQISLFLFCEKDVWEFVSGKYNPNLLSLEAVLGYSIFLTSLYVCVFVWRQHSVLNLVKKKCDPIAYYERYLALYIKLNNNDASFHKMNCDFLSGNWNDARTTAIKFITTSKNVNKIRDAYYVMMQIYAVEGDLTNMTALYQSLINAKDYDKSMSRHIDAMLFNAKMYLDYLNGDPSTMIDVYDNACKNSKSNSDKYMSMFYLALGYAQANKIEEALSLLGEIVKGSNTLFINDFCKKILMAYLNMKELNHNISV